MISFTRRRTTCPSSWPIGTGGRCACRTLRRSSTRWKTCGTWAWRTGRPLCLSWSIDSRSQHHRDGRSHPRCVTSTGGLHSRRHHAVLFSDRTESFARRCTMSRTLAISVLLVILVVFVFLRRRACDAYPCGGGAGVAHQHVRRDVPLRVQSRQSLAHGAHDRNGFVVDDAIVVWRISAGTGSRGCPLQAAAAGCTGNYLHSAVDDTVACRGLSSHPADGGHDGQDVPRVCRHALGGDSRLARRVADDDPHDVRQYC